MPILFAIAMFLMPAGPGYLVGGARTTKVHDYDYKIVYCSITIKDGGDHGEVDAKGCTKLGAFAKVVKITGDYKRQSYTDAAGNEVAWGTQKEDGYWFYTPDGKRYYLD